MLGEPWSALPMLWATLLGHQQKMGASAAVGGGRRRGEGDGGSA